MNIYYRDVELRMNVCGTNGSSLLKLGEITSSMNCIKPSLNFWFPKLSLVVNILIELSILKVWISGKLNRFYRVGYGFSLLTRSRPKTTSCLFVWLRPSIPRLLVLLLSQSPRLSKKSKNSRLVYPWFFLPSTYLWNITSVIRKRDNLRSCFENPQMDLSNTEKV